jgi:hypothetical protein
MDGEGLTTDQLKSLEEYLPTLEEEGQVITSCILRFISAMYWVYLGVYNR